MKVHRVRLCNVRFTSAEAMPWEVHRDEACGWPCPYCWNIMSGKCPPTWDHVIPRSQGGTDNMANLLPVCRDCNWQKGNMSLPEWHGWLLAVEDKRALVVGQLLEWIARDDRDLTVGFAAEAGIGYAKGRASQKAAEVQLGPIDLEKEKQARSDWRSMVWDTLYRIGIPRTHWAYHGTRHVRVLLGSVPELFEATAGDDLAARVCSHPRYHLTKNVRIA